MEKNGIGSQKFGGAKKPVSIWLTHRFIGTHTFVLILTLIYWAIILNRNYFLTTYGYFFENFFEKIGTSDFLFLAIARPIFANLIF